MRIHLDIIMRQDVSYLEVHLRCVVACVGQSLVYLPYLHL